MVICLWFLNHEGSYEMNECMKNYVSWMEKMDLWHKDCLWNGIVVMRELHERVQKLSSLSNADTQRLNLELQPSTQLSCWDYFIQVYIVENLQFWVLFLVKYLSSITFYIIVYHSYQVELMSLLSAKFRLVKLFW